MKILSKIWNFLVEWGEELNEHRRKNYRTNVWY